MTVSHLGERAILGTPAYMSPEQARGKGLDKRSDIWSFGCVLFEMLAGRTAFGGETISDTIARVLERDLEWDALPPSVPLRIRDLIRRCLQKDAARRLRDIGDARIELDEALTAPATQALHASGSRPSRSRSVGPCGASSPPAHLESASWPVRFTLQRGAATVLSQRFVS